LPAGVTEPKRVLDVIFVPTPQRVVEKMLELAQVSKDDIVYDLGCGDGRIVVTAAKKFGCRAVGFDIDPERLRESNENVARNRVDGLVQIKDQDIFSLDLARASVVTMYLLPDLNKRLLPQLERLKPGSRIVSHAFPIPGVVADKSEQVTNGSGRGSTVYLYTIPLKKAAEIN
jgi:ribosomal protein L11 methylase PrmA